MNKFLETTKVIIICITVFLVAAGSVYACNVLPMQECMDEGHSFNYCHRLLNR